MSHYISDSVSNIMFFFSPKFILCWPCYCRRRVQIRGQKNSGSQTRVVSPDSETKFEMIRIELNQDHLLSLKASHGLEFLKYCFPIINDDNGKHS